MKTFAASTIAILFTGMWTTAASAADPIGAAVRVVNSVTAEADQSVHPVAQGDGVRQNETIEVAADSLGELRLNDQTKVALGPNSKLKLDKFVYDPDKATGTIAVDLAKGAFRFITGAAKKSSYIIRSPNAAITVRGTVFDVYVDANGTMWVLLHEGSIEVCNSAGQCKAVRNSCGLVRVGPGGVLSEAATWNKQPEVSEIAFEVAFPFVVNPPEFDPVPRFTRASIETGTCNSQDLQPPSLRRAETLPPANYSSAPAPTPRQPIQQAQTNSASSQTPPASDSVAPSEPVLAGSWSGPYIGVSMGGGWGGGDTSVACDDPTGSFDTVFNTPNCAYPIATGALETQYDTNPSGFIGGAVGGYNVQLGNFVWGVEADVSVSSIDGSDTQSRDVPPTSPGTRTVTQELDWLTTVRGRLGIVTGDLLVYATAGLAVGGVDYSYQSSFPQGDAFARVSESQTEFGWTAGAGAELAFGQWSVKGEYLYFDLGQEELRTQFFIFGGVPTPAFFEPEFETQGHIARVGLNYHFK